MGSMINFIWILPIIIALIVLIVFNNNIKQHYKALVNRFSLLNENDGSAENMISSYLTIDYPPSLHFMRNFQNVTSSLLLRFIEFLILSLLTHFVDTTIIPSIFFVFFTSIELFKYINRKKLMNDVLLEANTSDKKFLANKVKTVYSYLLIYTVIVGVLMYLVWMLK